MDLTLFASMLLRRGWIVALFLLLGGAAGLALAQARTPLYGATTRVKVQPARPADLGQTQAIREIMRSYMRDIRTVDMAAAVRQRLCGDADPLAQRLCRELDAGALRAMIEVGADENVFEVRIKARAPDPAAAVKVSEQTAHAFLDQREKANRQLDLRDRILVEIREAPQPRQDVPRRKLYVAAAALLGAAAGGALVLLLQFLERSVVLEAADARRLMGAPVLARVPPARRRTSRPGRVAVAALTRQTGRAARLLAPVALLAALGAFLGLGLSRAQTVSHVARARIAVEPARGSDWGQSLAIREITRGFSEDIHTAGMAAEVNERLQLDLPSAVLLEKVRVAPEVEVYEITVEAFDTDPEVAAEIAETWASLFVERRRIANLELDQSDRILTRLRDRTEVELWSPKVGVNVLAGLLVGAMVGAGAVHALHVVRSRVIRDPDDAGHATRAPVLAAVPPRGGGRAARRSSP